MPYGMSDVEYAKEVSRKQSLGIPLTQPLDKAAYERGMAQLSTGGTSPATQSATARSNLSAIPPAPPPRSSGSSRPSSGGGGGSSWTSGSSRSSSYSSGTALADAVQRRIDRYISDFGSPLEYARSIVEKTGGGGWEYLTDPEAAKAFAEQYPEAMQAAVAERSVPGGSANLYAIPPVGGGSAQPQPPQQPPPWWTQPPEWLRMPPPPPWEFPQPTPPPPPPPGVETAPKVEGVPSITEALTHPERLPEGVRRGVGGFEYAAAPRVVLPDEEELYRIYREVFGPGTEERYVRHYLASPQFRRVLGGAVPMHMATDPLWREYLNRLGVLESIERRLARGAEAVQ